MMILRNFLSKATLALGLFWVPLSVVHGQGTEGWKPGAFPLQIQNSYGAGGSCTEDKPPYVWLLVRDSELQVHSMLDILTFKDFEFSQGGADPARVVARPRGRLAGETGPVFVFENAGTPDQIVTVTHMDSAEIKKVFPSLVDVPSLSPCAKPRITLSQPIAQPAAPQERWVRVQTDRQLVASFCPTMSGPTKRTSFCINIGCRKDQPATWSLTLVGDHAGFNAEGLTGFQADWLVDGSFYRSQSHVLAESGNKAHFQAGLDLNAEADLLRALQKGARFEIRLRSGDMTGGTAGALRGSSRALKGVASQCFAEAFVAQQRAFNREKVATLHETELTDDPESIAAVTKAICATPGQVCEVVSLATYEMDSGRRLFFAELGGGTVEWGMTGHGTATLSAEPGQAPRFEMSFPGVAVKIDPTSLSQGWPDIWFQSVRGMNPPYGVWSRTETGYAFNRNVQVE